MTTPPTDGDDQGAFLALIAKHNKGRTSTELDDALTAIISAVIETGKAGKLTYTVAIKPDKAVAGMVVVTDDVKTSAPRFERRGDAWFVDDTGQLSREHPNQPAMINVEDCNR